MANIKNGFKNVSSLGLSCSSCSAPVTEIPAHLRTDRPVRCAECERDVIRSRPRREVTLKSKVWEMGKIEFEGKSYELPVLYLSDGTHVIPGARNFKPDLGPFPQLHIRRGSIKGLKVAYATLVDAKDAPSQMVYGKAAPAKFANLIYKERELMSGKRVISAFTDELIEVSLHPSFVGKVVLGKSYYSRLVSKPGFISGHPVSLAGTELVLNGYEAREAEERRLGPTGVDFHRIICKWPANRPLPEDKKKEKHPIFVSESEVIDCFEHLSACSKMEVTVESTTDEINKAYKTATKRFGGGRTAAAFKEANVDVDPVVTTRNNVRLHELKMACEKAKKARAWAIEAEVSEFVEFTIRAGKTEQHVIESLVKKLINEIGDLKIFVYDSRITIPEDREAALNFVANHIVVAMAKDIAGVISDEAKIGDNFVAIATQENQQPSAE